jgi:GxxExxY protein
MQKKRQPGEFEPVPEGTDRVAAAVVDAAFRVHEALGPGLLESVYEACLCRELSKRKLAFRTQVAVPIVYDGVKIDGGLRLDVLVEDCLVVEIKATEQANPLFEAQLLTYLKMTGHRLGLLINFNVRFIRDGIQRIIL